MKRYAVIGLGRFGSRLASNLAMSHQEVIAIDNNHERVEEMRDRVTLTVALDATDEDALKQHGIDQVDVAIVGIGGEFNASILATVVLKQIGVPHVISRATSVTEAKILEKVGADQVVNPEDEAADRWSNRLISPGFLSQFEVAAGMSIVEIATPKPWVDKTLIDLELRSKHGLHVIGLKSIAEAAKDLSPKEAAEDKPIHLPKVDEPLKQTDVLLVMGADSDLAKLPAG